MARFKRVSSIAWLLLLDPAAGWVQSAMTADQIVQRSVVANDADWKAAPNYSFLETDSTTKGGKTTRTQYQVLMIEGSTYHRLIATGGQPISASQASQEEAKLQKEIARRRKETPDARKARIAKYAQERRQDHELMTEMVKAFQYKLAGRETINGHRCYVIEASPRPGYSPPNRDTRVLVGMRGTLWIDQEEFQWVKVHAEVFRPVAFGLFIAHVEPGTDFTLEEAPVADHIWLPTHFSTHVKSKILSVLSRNSSDDETYTDYHPIK